LMELIILKCLNIIEIIEDGAYKPLISPKDSYGETRRQQDTHNRNVTRYKHLQEA